MSKIKTNQYFGSFTLNRLRGIMSKNGVPGPPKLGFSRAPQTWQVPGGKNLAYSKVSIIIYRYNPLRDEKQEEHCLNMVKISHSKIIQKKIMVEKRAKMASEHILRNISKSRFGPQMPFRSVQGGTEGFFEILIFYPHFGHF